MCSLVSLLKPYPSVACSTRSNANWTSHDQHDSPIADHYPMLFRLANPLHLLRCGVAFLTSRKRPGQGAMTTIEPARSLECLPTGH